MTVTAKEKDRLVADIRDAAEGLRPPEIGPAGACLVNALAAVYVLRSCGRLPHRVILQGGSASWPRLRPDQDDGRPETCTHFTYQFEPEAAARSLAAGVLPEMHVWAAVLDPAGPQIVDVTTRYLMYQCRKTAGAPWPGDPPPDYIWAPAADMPPGVSYRPDPAACVLASQLAEELLCRIVGESPGRKTTSR